MSTGTHALLVGLTLLAAGCAGGGTGTPNTGIRELRATSAAIGVIPGGAEIVRFELFSGNVPLAGETVNFIIADGDSARGATLSRSSAKTDVAGAVTVEVRAGQETMFRIVATTAGAAEVGVLVVVEVDDLGSVVVAPFFAPVDDPPPSANSVEVSLYTNTNCGALAIANPKLPNWGPLQVAVKGGLAPFHLISTRETAAIVGQAIDFRRAAIATGCLDLPGSSLRAMGVVQVALPLYIAVPDPIGTFLVTSKLVFAPKLAASSLVAAAWQDLADCPLDPAELWIDCTIDALSPATPDDPLDCKLAAGGESPLGDALAARRGAPLLDGDDAPTGCRGPRIGDANSPVSLDAILLGMFGSPLPPGVRELPGIAQDAASILERVTLESTLDVRAGSGSSGTAATFYTVSHTLEKAVFGPADRPVNVALAPLALPILSTTAAAWTRDRQFVMERHGFTLRLGTATRAAFGALALEHRGLPGDVAGFVAALAALARSPDGRSTGCVALDAVFCPAVGYPADCLTSACLAGLSGLAKRLNDSFDAAEGAGLDLFLEGSGPLLDSSGNRAAERIGKIGNDSEVGIWSVDLRANQDRSSFSAEFGAERRH